MPPRVPLHSLQLPSTLAESTIRFSIVARRLRPCRSPKMENVVSLPCPAEPAVQLRVVGGGRPHYPWAFRVARLRAERTFSPLSASVSLAVATSRLAFRVARLRTERAFSVLSLRIPVRAFINYPPSLQTLNKPDATLPWRNEPGKYADFLSRHGIIARAGYNAYSGPITTARICGGRYIDRRMFASSCRRVSVWSHSVASGK